MTRVALYWLTTVFLCGFGLQQAGAQCILTNPSFEIGDSGANVFAGWNQWGVVGSSTDATHGSVAAKVIGPNWGEWQTSGYWQQMDTSPGERWSVSVDVWHTSTNPIIGQSKAIVNIEWRDINDDLIDFETRTAADATTPIDEVQEFAFESQPAPLGTVKTRILVAVLQSSHAHPIAHVYYDQVTFYNLTSPTQDEIQWNDFPGLRTLEFSGRTWRVKGPGYYGPGPNLFSDSPSATWVDVDDRLHMTIQNFGGSWYSTEITLQDALGYGDYIFTTVGRLDMLHPNAVLGIFLWEYGPCWDPAYLWWNPYNEIDIEYSRWSDPGNDLGQFVAQPWDWYGNINRFDATFSEGEVTSHAFRWLPDRVEFRSWRGGANDETPGNMIHEWTYTGPHISRPEQPRVHINLWQVNGPPSSNQEVVFEEFTYIPEFDPTGIPDVTVFEATHLSPARPNPFNPTTTIGYTVRLDVNAEIIVYDVKGRRVRTLVNKFVPAGYHEVLWDGRDDLGNRVASGVYLYQLRAGGIVETRKMVLLK
ncbi:MAG: T9SS type A sorting domain-containing protein [Candidatus Latescibacterota bacterium]|nr:MAG: T9SS type A sorting domain-containing protein [Candidatus Latescibacterota bacterium]